MLKEIRAVLCDGDQTLYDRVARSDFGLGMRAALKELASLDNFPPDHPQRLYLDSDEFLKERVDVYDRGICPHHYFGERYEIDPRLVFEEFHKKIEVSMQYDTGSVPVLNALKGRTILHTDASKYWAEKHGAAMGHELAINSRSCWGNLGYFDQTKSTGRDPWRIGHELVEAKLGESLLPEQILVPDDNAAVLAYAAPMGYRLVQCVRFGAKPHPDFKQISHVGTHLADIFGLPRPEWDAEQLTPPPVFR